MRLKVTALLAATAALGLAGSAFAHHSFAMFDQEHPIELSGTVKEFKFTSPHTFILLEVKSGGESQVWNLEGGAPGGLARDGWPRPGARSQRQIPSNRRSSGGCAAPSSTRRSRSGKSSVVVRTIAAGRLARLRRSGISRTD